MLLFEFIVQLYNYSAADRDGRRDYSRDGPSEEISKLGASAVLLLIFVNNRSSPIHLHGFQLLLLLFKETISLVHTKRVNLLHLRWSSNRQVIVSKGFLELPNLPILIKQKTVSLPRNQDQVTFGELLIVFSTKVNLLSLL